MKILITGKSGYVATSLYKALKNKYEITTVGRSDFELTSSYATKAYLQDKYFDVVIHTAVSGGSRLRSDSYKDMDTNLLMYYNLLQNRLSYGKLINFGSGAEVHMTDQPYGFSKQVISKSIEHIDKFYNLRIYNVFDETELDTRFIKGNIQRYIDKEDIQVHQHKKMDFFYMQDLVSIVDHYIQNDNLPKSYDCVYEQKQTLLDIAMMINKLDKYKVAIVANNEHATNYIGEFKSIGINYIGLEEGIRQVYNKLK
jgi:GDP-L-fucose synthase